MNLLKIAERIANSESAGPPVTFLPELCLHRRDSFAECDACFSVCPVNAIRSGKPPQLDMDACAGCLACLPICSVGAYRGDDALRELLQAVACLDVSHVELLCAQRFYDQPADDKASQGPATSTAIEINGCLASLGVGSYLALLSYGVERIDVRTDACVRSCPWADLRHQIETHVKQVQVWLAIWQRSEIVSLSSNMEDEWASRPLHKAGAPRISRRDLLRGVGRNESATDEPPIPDSKQPFHERLRLLRALRKWPTPEPSQMQKTVPCEAGFSMMHVDASCSACGVCTRACPTSALELEREDGQFTLTFFPRACIGCNICVHLCPEEAITAHPHVHFDDVFSRDGAICLRSGHVAICARCRAPFVPAELESKYCPPCDFRRKNPFGAQMPPGLRRKQQA